MELAAAVLTYYFTRAGELSPEKRFHLANRISAWNRDERAVRLLADCKGWYVPQPPTTDALAARFQAAGEEAERTLPRIVAYEERKPYFERYPDLPGLEAELFRLRHLRDIYHIDASEAFAQRHSADEIRTLATALQGDEPALRVLSTWAINFLYLAHQLVLGNEDSLDKERFYSVGETFDVSDAEQLRLLLYLYTHCIIADSNFYARPVPETSLPVYKRMLARLETLLGEHFQNTSLDTKLEFLVACRLAGYDTLLREKIHAECAQSLSPEGTFVIDTQNVFSQNQHRKTFEASEHRNVLFAMSALPRH